MQIKRWGRMALGALLTWCMLAVVGEAPAANYPPAVGQRHPEFTLPAIDDRRAVSLSDFRGKKVLLIQFASW